MYSLNLKQKKFLLVILKRSEKGCFMFLVFRYQQFVNYFKYEINMYFHLLEHLKVYDTQINTVGRYLLKLRKTIYQVL